MGADPDSPLSTNNNHLHRLEDDLGKASSAPPPSACAKPPRLSLERSFSVEEEQQKRVECPLQPARVYSITSQLMSGGRGSKESLELEVLKEKAGGRGAGSRGGLVQPSTCSSSTSSSPTQQQQQQHASSSRGSGHHHHCNHHHGNHHHTASPSTSSGAGGSSSTQQASGSHGHHHHHHHLSQPPLQASVSAHNIRSWSESARAEADCGGLACESCSSAPSRSQGSLDLESTAREAGKQRRGRGRRVEVAAPADSSSSSSCWASIHLLSLLPDDTNWFPKENLFSFQTATTTMQA